MAKEDTFYVRNARPNKIVFSYAGTRTALEHRGHRQDSTALPKEAQGDPTIARWLKDGHLEQITRDSFMKLGQRQVDTLPNEYLQRPVRQQGSRDLEMVRAETANSQEQDTTGALTHVKDSDVKTSVNKRLKSEWAGELMTTEEELEELSTEDGNYPSKYRDTEVRKQMGY